MAYSRSGGEPDQEVTSQSGKSAVLTELIIPAFTRRKLQLSGREIESTRKISVRIQIERVIGLIKNRYTI